MIESLEETTNPDKTDENGDFNLLISNNNIMLKKRDWVLKYLLFCFKIMFIFSQYYKIYSL
jgi:hypothetical protein